MKCLMNVNMIERAFDLWWTRESYTSPESYGMVGIATALQPKIDISFPSADALKQHRMRTIIMRVLLVRSMVRARASGLARVRRMW